MLCDKVQEQSDKASFFLGGGQILKTTISLSALFSACGNKQNEVSGIGPLYPRNPCNTVCDKFGTMHDVNKSQWLPADMGMRSLTLIAKFACYQHGKIIIYR